MGGPSNDSGRRHRFRAVVDPQGIGKLASLLLKNAAWVVPFDGESRPIADGGLFAVDGVIGRVGPTSSMPRTADEVVDASGMLILPGFVNTHHHLYQTLTRAVPGAQGVALFDWLRELYPLWQRLTPEAVYVSALTGFAELILSGCTTAVDHLYIYPNGCRIDDEIQAAQEIGVRFHACRGSMSLGESEGGLPPDELVEDEPWILRETRRAIETFHDASAYSMLRIAVAPCSPFSVSEGLMRDSAALARSYGVMLHTHLAETLDEEAYCLRRFGRRPVAYVDDLGWMDRDVWHVHCVHLTEDEIELLAETGTGVCHSPSSNMRLGSGIAPVRLLLDSGASVSLGVDGSASNDSSHLLAEARQAMLLQRVTGGPRALSAYEVLGMLTKGGARVLGRDDLGELTEGKAADFIGFDLERLSYAGALHDPVAALVFCAPQTVELSVIAGRVIVKDGQLRTVDLPPLVERHNRLAHKLMAGSS